MSARRPRGRTSRTPRTPARARAPGAAAGSQAPGLVGASPQAPAGAPAGPRPLCPDEPVFREAPAEPPAQLGHQRLDHALQARGGVRRPRSQPPLALLPLVDRVLER